MDMLSFALSPLGIMFIALLLFVSAVMVRSVSIGTRQQRIVYATLLDAAKRRAHLRITGIVSLRRRAETLRPLFAHLSLHGYAKLELLVVVYQTAGSRATPEVRKLAKEYGLVVRTVTYRKGTDSVDLVKKQKKSDLTLTMGSGDTFTNRFFEYVSFAFTQKAVSAVQLRRIVPPVRSLTSGYHALRTLFGQLISTAATFSTKAHSTLQPGVIVRTKVLTAHKQYTPTRVLFDDFGLRTASVYSRATWRSIVSFVAALVIVVLLIIGSPTDILAYVSLLTAAVLMVIATLTVGQSVGLSGAQKAQLIALLPLMPLFWCVDVVLAVLLYAKEALSRLVTRLKVQITPQAQPARTRK